MYVVRPVRAPVPPEVPADYNEELSRRSAAYINFPQAIPSTYSIDREIPPCVNRCPINLNARDYVGLIAEGKFLDALDVIREKLPFPGTIGRICNHPCEDVCLRGEKVTSLAICALKRFAADYEVGRREMPMPRRHRTKPRRSRSLAAGRQVWPAPLPCGKRATESPSSRPTRSSADAILGHSVLQTSQGRARTGDRPRHPPGGRGAVQHPSGKRYLVEGYQGYF